MLKDRDTLISLIWLVAVNLIAAAVLYYLISKFELASPFFLWALLAIPLASAWYLWKRMRSNPSVKLSALSSLSTEGDIDIMGSIRPLPFALSLVGLSLLIMSMARPQLSDEWKDVTREGIDIMLAIDVSTSMLAKDFKPNRLEGSKRVAIQFIEERPNDRIGLVVYAAESFTQCPLTTDHDVLIGLFDQVDLNLIQIEDGTAVGMGLGTAINRLRESDSKSKVIILLTDGVSNAGTLQPLDAAAIAKTYGMRVYTIGVGSLGRALSPVARYPNGKVRYDYVDVEIDEETLKSIASETDGKYFRATDAESLRNIYKEIDQLEKTRIKVTEHNSKTEEYFPFILTGGILFFLGVLLDNTVLRSMP